MNIKRKGFIICKNISTTQYIYLANNIENTLCISLLFVSLYQYQIIQSVPNVVYYIYIEME